MDNINSLLWVNSSCNGCGSDESQLLFEGSDIMMDLPGHFRLVECSQCGLIRQNPHLKWESLKDYYPEDYAPFKKIIDTEQSIYHRINRRYGMWKRIRTLERFQKGGRLLDVGCGTGVFLGEAQRFGHWELKGVEPSVKAAIYVQETLGIPVLAERFDQINLPINHFDVITMWNVLEHLETPIQDLHHAFQLIRPGGWLILTIPNIDGLGVKIFGKYWMGWDLPRHLYLFPQKRLGSILDEIGFTWVDTQCIAGAHSSLYLSIEFLLKANKIDSPIIHILLCIYQALPTRIILSPIFWLTDYFRQCSLITVFAQKKSLGDSL